MDRFPAEFEDLLNKRGRTLIAASPPLEDLIARRRTPIAFFEGVIDRGMAAECVRLLDEGLYARLRRFHTPIPREAVAGMTVLSAVQSADGRTALDDAANAFWAKVSAYLDVVNADIATRQAVMQPEFLARQSD